MMNNHTQFGIDPILPTNTNTPTSFIILQPQPTPPSTPSSALSTTTTTTTLHYHYHNHHNHNHTIPTTTDGDYSNITSNLTEQDYYRWLINYITPTDVEWILIVAYFIVFLVGLVGNFLVCFAVWRNKQMRTVTNIFIFNLSTADLMVIMLVLPASVTVDVTETWFAGLVMCKLLYYLQCISVSVSVLTLTAISVERFYAICHPLRFRSTKKRARIVISTIWIFSMAISINELVVLEVTAQNPYNIYLSSCGPRKDLYYQSTLFQMVLAFFLYILPLGFMAYTYIRIARTLWNDNIPSENGNMQNDNAASGSSTQVSNQVLARRNVAKMLIVVVVAFAVCYLPVHLVNIIRYMELGLQNDIPTMKTVTFIAHWLCYFNSAINPVIYNFMSAKFRIEFADACRFCCCCSPCRGGVAGRRMNTVRNQSLNSFKYTVNNTQVDQVTLSLFNNDENKKLKQPQTCPRSILKNHQQS